MFESARTHRIDENIIVFFSEVFIQLAFRDPGPVFVMRLRNHVWEHGKTTIVMGTKEVCSNTMETFVYFFFLFCFTHLADSVDEGELAEKLYFPFVAAVEVEKILLCTHHCLTPVHRSCWEFPLLSKLVLKDQEKSVLTCIMHTSFVIVCWVNKPPVFTGSTVRLIAHLVCRMVIKVHHVRIRILGQDVFIHFGYFLKLIDVLLLVKHILVHELTAQFKELYISV